MNPIRHNTNFDIVFNPNINLDKIAQESLIKRLFPSIYHEEVPPPLETPITQNTEENGN